MNADETAHIIALITLGWPRHQIPEQSLTYFGTKIAHLPFHETCEALDELTYKLKYAPSIAEICQAVIERRCSLPDPQRAWTLVCRRYGDSRDQGDRSIELCATIVAALDAAGIDAFRFHTVGNRYWLEEAFIRTYTVMRADALEREDRASRILDAQARQNGRGRLSLGVGENATLPDETNGGGRAS